MAEKIQRITKGKPPSLLNSELANRVIDTCNAFRNMEVFGAAFNYFGDRASLIIAPQSGSSSTPPLTTRSAGNNKAIVTAGNVNDIDPTVGGIAISNAPAPQLTLVASGVVYLACVLEWDFDAGSLGEVIAATIESAATTPESTLELAVLQLATVSEDYAITVTTSGNKRLLVWQGEFVFA